MHDGHIIRNCSTVCKSPVFAMSHTPQEIVRKKAVRLLLSFAWYEQHFLVCRESSWDNPPDIYGHSSRHDQLALSVLTSPLHGKVDQTGAVLGMKPSSLRFCLESFLGVQGSLRLSCLPISWFEMTSAVCSLEGLWATATTGTSLKVLKQEDAWPKKEASVTRYKHAA